MNLPTLSQTVRKKNGSWGQAAPFALLLLFWWVSVLNLGRYPLIEEDEPWILSPGYKLFTQGVYGSDLFRGFHSMDQFYFEFMPLMSWLEGATTHWFGVGVLQMRWLAVVLGALTLALTWALARRLTGPSVGLLAMTLLLFWQWTSGAQRVLGSGVPLVDLTRIARYDILVPPLGLSALWAAWQARRSGRARYDALSGLLGGLAGLAHLYGLFWLGGALILRLFDPEGFTVRRALRSAAWMMAGAVVVWLPWLSLIGVNWAEFRAQTAQYGDRFNVFSLSFYLNNLVDEPHRYFLGARSMATWTRLGFWLFVAGLPAAWLWMGVHVLRRRERGLAWLWTLSLLFPVWFALLIRIKTFSYLLSVAPLWAMILGWALRRLFGLRPAGRWLAAGCLAIAVLQGSLGILWMQSYAGRADAPEKLFAELRQAVPPSARLLGPNRYWLAFRNQDYRSLVLPFFLSNPQYNTPAVSFEAAVGQVAPQMVIIDLYSDEYQNNYAAPALRHPPNVVRTYLYRHHARLVRTFYDNYGQPVELYQLEAGDGQIP